MEINLYTYETNRNIRLGHRNVQNTYLEAPLDHKIYINLPVELYQDNNQPIKIKLDKCLYESNNFINDVIQQLEFT
jgi:hypothetical protein